MKTYGPIAFIFICILSCTSVDKLMERGQYAQAFQTSLNKVRGEKKKKTEFVKALEKSFARLQEATSRDVDRLNTAARPEHWPLVLEKYQEMDKRQQQLEPLMPLVSETRYKAEFSFIDYTTLIRTAEESACQYYYDHAFELIRKTEDTGNREFARQAYEELGLIARYRKSYKDSDNVREKARLAGTTLIYIGVESGPIGVHGRGIEREVMTLPVSRLDNFWTDYTVDNRARQEADFTVTVEMSGIFFTPERESANRYTESKEILVTKDQKQTKKDTVVVVTQKEVYEKVKVDILELFREKKAELNGRMTVTDNRSREVIHSFPIAAHTQFAGYCCRAEGDERAMTEETRKKLDPLCELFPTDFIMAETLAAAVKSTLMAELEKLNLR